MGNRNQDQQNPNQNQQEQKDKKPGQQQEKPGQVHQPDVKDPQKGNQGRDDKDSDADME